MATIRDRVQKVEATLREYVQFRDSAQKAAKFVERVKQVAEAREMLDRAVSKVAVLSANSDHLSAAELAPTRKLPSPGKASEALQVVTTKLAQAPLSLNEGRDFTTFRNRFETYAQGVEAAVEAAFGEIERSAPTVDETFLKQVELVPSYAIVVRDIRKRRDEMRAVDLRNADPNVLQLFLGRRAAFQKAVDSLRPDDFPASVIVFFKAARRGGGAALELFTKEVRDWLAERDLLKKVRVTVESQ
jgi:hypothetical protein